MTRRTDIDKLYSILNRLGEATGGMQRLKDCDGYMNWPERGVYFFFSNNERRANSDELRLSRIGTHAVYSGTGTSLWDRLRTHRGTLNGYYKDGGNHRGSVFRRRVGEATIERDNMQDEYTRWAKGNSANRELRMEELELERNVSEYIRDLPFLFVRVTDEPGPNSERAFIERNTIALVSNFEKEVIDPRDEAWLGNFSPVREIKQSGLWNINHVGETYDPSVLKLLDAKIAETEPLR